MLSHLSHYVLLTASRGVDITPFPYQCKLFILLLLQVMALIAMDQPVSSHPDDIRDEKCKVLRCIPPVSKRDCILGQYVAAKGHEGYKDDPTVPPNSKTPTFAACRLFINNERWAGVPFVLRAGKALNERSVVVRIQLRGSQVPLFGIKSDDMRNEFVMRLQPGRYMLC